MLEQNDGLLHWQFELVDLVCIALEVVVPFAVVLQAEILRERIAVHCFKLLYSCSNCAFKFNIRRTVLDCKSSFAFMPNCANQANVELVKKA